MLDGDYIGAVQPFEIYDEARIEYLYQTLRHLVAFHIEQGGYRDFVINYVFEQPESLARLRHLLSDLDDVIYAFCLTCTEEEMEKRVRGRAQHRPPDPAQEAWELQRFRELTTIQEEAAKRGDLGFVVDTSRLSVAEAAEAIWQNIESVLAAGK
jgi:predicted kinase